MAAAVAAPPARAYEDSQSRLGTIQESNAYAFWRRYQKSTYTLIDGPNSGNTVDTWMEVTATQPGSVSAASAANLATQTSAGATLFVEPGQWIVSSTPAAGTAASASRAAGAAGVRHVLTGMTITFSATTALAGITTVTFNLRDGASGAGSVLASWQVTLPAATVPAQTIIQLDDLSIVGSAATAMTLEGSANVGNLMESIAITGYDAS